MNTKIALIDSNSHTRPLTLYIKQILEALGQLFVHQFEFILLDADSCTENILKESFQDISVILSDVPENQLPEEYNQLLRKESNLFNRQTPYIEGTSGHFGVGYCGVYKNLYYPLPKNNDNISLNAYFLAMLETTALMLEKNFHLSREAILLRMATQQVYRAENLSDHLLKDAVETEQLHQQILNIIRSDQWLPEELHSSKQVHKQTQQVFN